MFDMRGQSVSHQFNVTQKPGEEWEIVEAVASIDPFVPAENLDDLLCIFCEETGRYTINGLDGTHKPDCPYLKAVRLVAERKPL